MVTGVQTCALPIYFIGETQFEFLLRALELVATHGWKLLPNYSFEPVSGQWRHLRGRPEPVKRLTDVSYASGRLEHRTRRATEPESALAGYLEEAEAIFAAAVDKASSRAPVAAQPAMTEGFRRLRWFPLPDEVQSELLLTGPDRPSAPQTAR